MKKLSVILVGVLFCTQVFASGNVDVKRTAGSSSAVVKSAGAKIVKVYYKSDIVGFVDISILNSSGQRIFNETVHKTKGFIRPYNLEGLPNDNYIISIKDHFGEMEEIVSNFDKEIHKVVSVTKLKDGERYLITVISPVKEAVTIAISDSENNLLYREAFTVEGGFARIFNLKNAKDYSIDITDKNGLLKSIKN